MSQRRSRNLIRVFVATALCAALIALAAVPVPESLPAVTFRQPALYRLEVALLVFYGSLLLITPAFSGLVSGRLPTEISTRGAKFAEEANHSDEATDAANQQFEQDIRRLADRLAAAESKINRPQKGR